MAPDKPLNTLYDFLYVDEDRLRSFYAQAFSGVLEHITTQYRTDTISQKSVSVGPEALVKGTKAGSTSSGEQIESVSVPADLAHLDVLSKLTEAGFLQSRLDHVQVGQLVHVKKTSLSILDASNLHEFMNTMPIRDMAVGTKHEKQEQEKHLKLAQRSINALYKMIPLGIQVHGLTESGQQLWGTLKNEYLRESPASLSLKHGSQLQGTWRVVGIVDAMPGEHQTDFLGNPLQTAFSNLHNEMRNLLGRSRDAYGVLPLLIFREIQKEATGI